MSTHRPPLMVTLVTLIFSAASAAADRMGPRSRQSADTGTSQDAGTPSQKGATPDCGRSVSATLTVPLCLEPAAD